MTVLDDLPGTSISVLFAAPDGNLSGATSNGGAFGHGAVFSLTPAGVMKTLYSFSGGADGRNPSILIEGADGNFYGTTSTSSYYGAPVSDNDRIFQLTPTGILNTLWTFTPSEGPAAAFLQGSDGDFYGTTTATSSSSYYPNFQTDGTVFKLPFAEVANSPLLSSADSPIAAVGQPFAYHVTANHHPTSYAASGLPAGLTLDAATGLISGTPSQVAASAVSLVAQTDAGTARATLSLEVVPSATLAAPTASVPVGAGKTGVFLVTLSAPAADKVVVNYTIAGSAINGTDYRLLTGQVKFGPGETSRPIDIVPKGDLDGAARKMVKLTLAPGDGYAPGTPGPVKIELFDAGKE